MTATPRFSKQTLLFIEKAARQKRPDWLDKNRAQYEKLLLQPLQHLARQLKSTLAAAASGYHFPQKGIGRLKRPTNRVLEHGGGPFKSWVAYSASRPSESRFERNPSLFFMIDPTDPDDSVLVAGGLYMPSSRQLRAIRAAIAEDATAFDRLFATRDFARCFPQGFSDERISSRPPRGFDPAHKRMPWLKLQGFFVWRRYTLREFGSAEFPALVARDMKQILRLNALLDQATTGRAPLLKSKKSKAPASSLLDRLSDIEIVHREMDF
jgi:uncharacterized protein (TIGR02453 family)